MNKQFWKATGIRCIRTFLTTILGVWTGGQLITEIDWKTTIVAALSATVYIFLTCIIGGLPEVEYKKNIDMNIPEPEGSYSDRYLTEEEKAAIRAEMDGDEDV